MRVPASGVPAVLSIVAMFLFCALPLSAQVDDSLHPILPPQVLEEQAPPPPPHMEAPARQPAIAVESNGPRRVETQDISTSRIFGTTGEIFLSGPPVGLGGVFLSALGTTHPDVALRLGTADSNSRFAVYPAGATPPVFTVRGDGLVGIGTNSPPVWGRLTVVAKPKAGGAFYAATYTELTASENYLDVAANVVAQQTLSAGVVNGHNLTGTSSTALVYGAGRVSLSRGLIAEAMVYPGSSNTATMDKAVALSARVSRNSGTITEGYGVQVNDVQATTGYGLHIVDLTSTNSYGIYQVGANDTNVLFGKTRIGGLPGASEAGTAFYVNGDAHVNGTLTGTKIKAHFQDIAEWVPSNRDLTPGTVVILDPEVPNQVLASSSAYDTSVAGVVSAQPGIILGEEGAGKEQIATTGRVKVRVDATNAPVRIGDLLVTSDIPGTAMRSMPSDFNGRRFHQPGTIIGKALEPLASGTGEILVLLSMQ